MYRVRILPLLLTLATLSACHPNRKELQASLDQLEGKFAAAEKDIATLGERIKALENDVAERDHRIAELEKERDGMSTELAGLREEQARRRAELETFRELFARLKKLIDAGTIKVSFRKGRMIVELASAVLFDSGKTELKPDGQKALDDLVVALQSVQDRDLMVAGHTDNVPIKTKRFKSNWELSTARAVVVVDYMTSKGFPADHLGAAGFGEFDPVGSNDTEDGKANNRRIEIVLMPNLGELKGIEDMISK